MAAIHFTVSGKVQGVYYRQSAKSEAESLGIKGWVKNNKDGTVEGIAIGERDALGKFIAWCHKGPALAIVTSVIANEVEEQPCSNFEVIRQ